MAKPALEANPGASFQAPTADLSSQPVRQCQISAQTATSIDEILVWQTFGGTPGNSGQPGQTQCRGVNEKKRGDREKA
jgi:hypothetical protein